jgi:hypothetical protein
LLSPVFMTVLMGRIKVKSFGQIRVVHFICMLQS